MSAATLAAMSAPLSAHAQQMTVVTVQNVMAGASSSGQDQVWIRSVGTTGVAGECVYQGMSLFYTSNNGDVSPDKVEALAITAKTTNTQVFLGYVIESGVSDFWGIGITRCRIVRISLGF